MDPLKAALLTDQVRQGQKSLEDTISKLYNRIDSLNQRIDNLEVAQSRLEERVYALLDRFQRVR